MSVSKLIPPYGGKLVDLVVSPEELEHQRSYAARLPSIRLSERSECDLELLANGGFSPLTQFVGREDYQRIVCEMRLASGHIFPIPIVLPVGPDEEIHLDRELALRNVKNDLLAIMMIEEVYEWEFTEAAQQVAGTQDLSHPFVMEMNRWGKFNIAGRLRVLELPRHYDFQGLRLTPAQTRERLEKFDRPNVVAFQTRNPLHRVHEELTKQAIESVDGVLLLQPSVGMTKPGDVDHFTRVRTYKAMARNYYDPQRLLLCLLPLAMRLTGPREALWHGLIRRNYGANYLIVGRDHASPGLDSTGQPFYGPYEAQHLVERFREELGVGVIPFPELVYVPKEERYVQRSQVTTGVRTASISGAELREQYLDGGENLPEWFTRPEVAEILGESYPPRHRQGVCVWFTGLSGAGKSTTAEILTILLIEHGRKVSLLDGDVVRTHLSSGLGFSRQDRDAHVKRLGFVASEVVKHGGIVICAAISPYQTTRSEVRSMIGKDRFIEVFVDTPLEVCEQRDTKGMYLKARLGQLKGFTGIDDPYERPVDPEITLDTTSYRAEANAQRLLEYMIQKGFVRSDLTSGVNG